MLNSNSNTIRWMIALLEIIFINPDPPLLWPVHAEKPMSHPRNSSSRKRMLYPRLTYGADKRYLRRKSLIKIYRRENRGERVSKGDVNEPGPNLLPLSSSSSFYSYESHVYERGDNAKIDQFQFRSLSSNCSKIVAEFLYFFHKSFHTIWNDALSERSIDRSFIRIRNLCDQSIEREILLIVFSKKVWEKKLTWTYFFAWKKRVDSGFVIKIVETKFI